MASKFTVTTYGARDLGGQIEGGLTNCLEVQSPLCSETHTNIS